MKFVNKFSLYSSFIVLMACGGEETSILVTVTEDPITEDVVEDESTNPITNTPTTDTPTTDTPIIDTPIIDTPTTDNPVDDNPVDDNPVDDFSPQELTLRWSPSYEDEEGNTVHKYEIETFTLYWGNEANNLTQVVEINNMGADSYVFTANTAGDYYFSVSVESIYGSKSQASNVIYKQVN